MYAVVHKNGAIDIVTNDKKRAESVASNNRLPTEVGPGMWCKVVGDIEDIRPGCIIAIQPIRFKIEALCE